MSRTLKRVPIDFQWPQRVTWEGYLNPWSEKAESCSCCNGSGSSPHAEHLKNLWYGYAPFKPEDRGSKPHTPKTREVRDLAERNTRRYFRKWEVNPAAWESAVGGEAVRLANLYNRQWAYHLNAADVKALVDEDRLHDLTKKNDGLTPLPEEVNAWSMRGFGHDAINQWVVVRAECRRLGYPISCAECDGDGVVWPSPETKKQSDAWTPTEPPTGEGYQLWEDTSEGSPASPVFATLDDLCAWCATGATTFGSKTATAAQWRQMLDAGFVHHTEGNLTFI